MSNIKEEINIKNLYGKECTLTKDEFIQNYNVKPETGLSSEEANEKLSHLGANEIRQNKPKGWHHYFFESLFSPFNSILLRNCCNFILHRCLFT